MGFFKRFSFRELELEKYSIMTSSVTWMLNNTRAYEMSIVFYWNYNYFQYYVIKPVLCSNVAKKIPQCSDKKIQYQKNSDRCTIC